jgi:hypothetical protein
MGHYPVGMVDHINGNTLNNCRNNLRVTNKSLNGYNAKIKSNNTSGYRGVSFNKKKRKWEAYIWLNKRRYHLGYFETKEEAYAKYKLTVQTYGNEFMRLE